MSRKIERLINLTIALLATKRYLTKSEIFRSVDGYEGSAETMERMFERDKDDLRNLGVIIEVGSFDPVFQDEAGYRIKPEGYSLNLGEISGVEIALLSLAAEAWRGAALDDAAHSALTKLHSMGVESDLDALPAISPRLNPTHSDFQVIALAISKREVISFSYLSTAMVAQIRTIEPYAIATRNSHWYLAGRDMEKNELRTFRLDRIDGEISISQSSQGFDIPAGFDVFGSLESDELVNIATLDIRKGKAHLLRLVADSCVDKGEWEQITVKYFDHQHFVDQILWHGADVLVIEPTTLRNQVIAALEEIVHLHA
ncbi:MAG: WYL domain-containing protein [Candidatus Planktophila sp.]|nr:WYL domain-containing protein [Candidatus Planktophila sp.]